MTAAPKTLAALLDIDRALAAEGVHAMSPYWRSEAERSYLHPTATTLVEEVGRGGIKTITSVKMDLAETLSGDFAIAPGERHYHTRVSENVAEAQKTLRITEQYLRILGVPFTRAGDTIDLEGMPRGLKILACRVGAVSGWRCTGWTADECAKFNNDGADPSAEVIASIRAMTITHPNARGRMFSSPLGVAGFFHETWLRGNTDEQLVGHAPTWIANPSITEEQTRRLERDPRIWSREYAAIAQTTGLGCFDLADIDRAFLPRNAGLALTDPVVVIDASSGASDTFAFGIARFEQARAAGYLSPLDWGTERDIPPDPRAAATVASAPFLRFLLVDGFEPSDARKLGSAGVVARIAAVARTHGASVVFADQRESFSLRSEFRREGLRFHELPWTSASKPAAVEIVRRWLRQGELALPVHRALRLELIGFEEKILPSGQFTFAARSGHDDHCALLITAAMAHLNGGLRARAPRSPGRRGGGGGAPPSRASGGGGGGWFEVTGPGTTGWG